REGVPHVTYQEVRGSYADGTPYTLHKPAYTFSELAYGSLDDALISPRVGPAVYGLGLLEAVPEADILSRADPDDLDQDGISGRPNWVMDSKGQKKLGRIGWKANKANLYDQTIGAFWVDMGITSEDLHPEDCTPSQTI